MRKLPLNFNLNKYGLNVRLVEEDDAEFIVKLRTDFKNSKFIHDTDASISKQCEWIKSYKEREEEGREYYFIFSNENYIPVGLYRLYNIHDNTFTGGSWVFINNCNPSYPILASIIAFEIAYKMLNLEILDAFDGCHVDNKKVDKANRLLGLKEIGRIQDTKGEYITYTLDKEDFYNSRDRILKLFRIN